MAKNLTGLSDHELVAMFGGSKSEAEAAFGEIYNRYALRLNAYCRSILNNREQAEDVFQETFIRFYQNVKPGHETGTIIGYLIKIARNLCLNIKRDTKATIPIDEIDFPVEPDTSYEDKEMTELVNVALELLDSQTKEAIVMRVYNDLSYHEIAEIMGIKEARARYLVFNGKHKIRQILSPYLKDA